MRSEIIDKELKKYFSSIDGQKSRRKITLEQQEKMQIARKKQRRGKKCKKLKLYC